VKFLYEHGADADIHTATNDGWTPFHTAASHGHLEVVKFLYEHGADADIQAANNNSWTPLNAASSNGHLEVVKFLYEHGADADTIQPRIMVGHHSIQHHILAVLSW
jgi:ankyrin repeat protein